MKYLAAFLLAFSIFLLPAFADTSGDINTSLPQPIVTGFFAYSAGNCTQNYGYPPSGCGTYQCFFVAGSTSNGSCRPTVNTACYQGGTWYATGSSGPSCKNDTHKWSCSSGTWAASECSNGCSAGACASSSTDTSTSTSTSSNSNSTTTTVKYSLSITSSIDDFSLIQNSSALKSLTVKNNGDAKVNNTKLIVAGIPDAWVIISPASFTTINVSSSVSFTLSFVIPENATVKEYDVTLTAKSDQAEASDIFKLKVLPSTQTVQNVIIPRYDGLGAILLELEKNLTELRNAGINSTEIEALFADIRAKILQANTSISSSDYFAASTTMDAIDSLSAELTQKIEAAKAAQSSNTVIIIIIVIVLIALGVVAYMLMPSKFSSGKNLPWKDDKDSSGFRPGKGFVPSETSQISKIMSDIQRKKKESARYQFGGKQ
ncbi:MAG: hypothetical protein HY364_05265 [Candidatus Aenigmarchaeota archaeon]|nr:hypothetical protein [Candidatus Aenigmarchaeota archaeon]